MELRTTRAWMRGVVEADLYSADMTLDGAIAVGLRLVSHAKPLIENMDLQIRHIGASLMAETDEERREFLMEAFSRAEYARQRAFSGLSRGFAMVEVTRRVQLCLKGGTNGPGDIGL